MVASTQEGAASVRLLQKLLTTIFGVSNHAHSVLHNPVQSRMRHATSYADIDDLAAALAAADMESFSVVDEEAILPASQAVNRSYKSKGRHGDNGPLYSADAQTEAHQRRLTHNAMDQYALQAHNAVENIHSRQSKSLTGCDADSLQRVKKLPQRDSINDKPLEASTCAEYHLIASCSDAQIGITCLGDPAGEPVLLLSGIGGHSGLFWSTTAPGLAGFLSANGYCCYLIDVENKGVCATGRAANEPQLDGAESARRDSGLYGWVTEDLPAALSWVADRHPNQRQRWVGHGAAGLVWWAVWARYPEFRAQCQAIMQVATTRTTSLARTRGVLLSRRTRFNWWLSQQSFAQRLLGQKDEVPLRSLGLGLSNETRETFNQWLAWCDGDDWVDPVDGFTYAEVIRNAKSQPYCSCWVAEQGVCATEQGVRALMGTLRLQNPRLFVIKEPFDNVTLLTSPEAVQNHFPSMLSWLSIGRKQTVTDTGSATGQMQQA